MDYDFSGYATKNDLLCGDGRIIRHDAFKDCDGKTVPLVWQHIHDDPTNVLGHAVLENRADGVYAYGYFNDTPKGQSAKALVVHGDVKAMSIYANQLTQSGKNVLHGNIREVSLVLAGANPGAQIENITFAHSDGTSTEAEDEAIFHMDASVDNLEHADANSASSDNSIQNGSDDEKTVDDVWNSFTEAQKDAVYYLIAQSNGISKNEAIEAVQYSNDASDDNSDGESDGLTVKEIFDSMTPEQQKAAFYIIGGASEKLEDLGASESKKDDLMKHNAFDNTNEYTDDVISHDDLNAALVDAKHSNSMRDTFLEHGIENIDILFPEAQNVTPTPAMINLTPLEWVSIVWNGTHKSPFSRIKSTAADLTKDEARAKGYVKGNKKVEEQFNLLYRKTTPQTVYKKQKLDRDDIIDITDFDVIAWMKLEMRQKLNEELSRAILIGDGRDSSSNDRINPENVRPIYQDADTYTIHYAVTYTSGATADDKSATLVDSAIKARKDYRGSGNPIFFATNEVITDMLLARDKMGRRMYKDETELASALRVARVVEVPVLEGAQRKVSGSGGTTTTFDLLGLIVNLNDYTIGADKGGAVSFFDDFDIDYNQQKYLIETRCSGALTQPYSAIALEIKHA